MCEKHTKLTQQWFADTSSDSAADEDKEEEDDQDTRHKAQTFLPLPAVCPWCTDPERPRNHPLLLHRTGADINAVLLCDYFMEQTLVGIMFPVSAALMLVVNIKGPGQKTKELFALNCINHLSEVRGRDSESSPGEMLCQ